MIIIYGAILSPTVRAGHLHTYALQKFSIWACKDVYVYLVIWGAQVAIFLVRSRHCLQCYLQVNVNPEMGGKWQQG